MLLLGQGVPVLARLGARLSPSTTGINNCRLRIKVQKITLLPIPLDRHPGGPQLQRTIFPPLPRFASSKNPLGRVRGGRPPPGTFVCANIPPSNRSCGIGAKHKRNGTISSGIVYQGRWPMYPIRGIAFVAWKFPVIMKCQNPGFGVPSHSL